MTGRYTVWPGQVQDWPAPSGISHIWGLDGRAVSQQMGSAGKALQQGLLTTLGNWVTGRIEIPRIKPVQTRHA